MSRDKNVTSEVLPSLRVLGWSVRHETSLNTGGNRKYVSGAIPGEPDIFCIKNRAGMFVEAKSFGQRFNTKDWTPAQRKWAENHSQDETIRYWVNGGSDRVNSKYGKYPKSAWLIPYEKFLFAVDFHENNLVRKSIPFSYFKDQMQMFEMTFSKGIWTPKED